MHIYFAQFLPDTEKSGVYEVTFPDLEDCATSGDTLAEALANAAECLSGYIQKIGGDGLPAPSGYTEARYKAETRCQELGMAIPVGTFYQAVPAAPANEKPVQIAVSMLPSLVHVIDSAARENGMTRSGLLALAARKFIQELATQVDTRTT